MYSNAYAWMPFLLLGSIVMIIVLLAIVVLFYVFYALGLYQMAKRRGVEPAWLAWIPIAWYYVVGKLADDYALAYQGGKRTNYALWLPLLYAIALACSLISTSLAPLAWTSFYGAYLPLTITLNIVAVVSAIVAVVFYFISLYKIYNWHTASSVALLVLSILFGFITPFVLFAIRNGDNPMLKNLPGPHHPQGGSGGNAASGGGPNYI